MRIRDRHNGYINIDNKKMSKSLGNFFTVREIAEEFDYEVIRFFMLSAHYRSPINFSKELMESAKSALGRIYTCLETLDFLAAVSYTHLDVYKRQILGCIISARCGEYQRLPFCNHRRHRRLYINPCTEKALPLCQLPHE